MRQLNYELKQLGVHNRDGSFATQAKRAYMLSLMADQPHDLGYKHLHAAELKGRHVNALLRLWQEHELAPGTVKNRLAALRWWAEKVGCPRVVQTSNATYGVPKRQYVATVSKARDLAVDKLAAIRDPHVRLSLEFQRAFGLRREEALKIKPQQADQGDRLVLQGSWTKGGRCRSARRRSAMCCSAPKRWWAPARSFRLSGAIATGGGCMSARRRGWAYRKCTGYGMPTRRSALPSWRALPPRALLTPEQQEIDAEVRDIIISELGHVREEITRMSLGR